MSKLTKTDVGAHVSLRAGEAVSIVAGGAGDAAEVTGGWQNRLAPGSTGVPGLSPRQSGPYLSCVLAIFYEAALADGESLVVGGVKVQSAADAAGTGAADYATLPDATIAAPEGGGVVSGVVRLDVRLDLSTCGGFLREKFTPNLSRANTDAALIFSAWVFGGSDVLPVV